MILTEEEKILALKSVQEFVKGRLPSFFVKHHVELVVKKAMELCEFHPDADREVVETGAWLHDIGHERFGSGYYQCYGQTDGDNGHHIRGAAIAKEFLSTIGFPKGKTGAVIHCIESHRTRKPPEPETIEARIVASADNLSHFIDFDFLAESVGFESALKKLERDLKADFMLPEALKEAEKLFRSIIVKRK